MIKSQNHDAGLTHFGPHNYEVRTAVILAAGMGVRLKGRGKLTPKGCMRLGSKSIIEESVLRLLSVGIQRIVIVTGHLAEQFDHLPTQYGKAVQLVNNPYFADSGSMYSLYCARQYLGESFLLLESDLVYERRALTKCLEHLSENVVLLSGFSNSSDEVFVETRDGCLVAMSKNRERLGSEVLGELVGICKISRSLFAAMLTSATDRFRTTRHMDYETDCLIDVAQLMPVSCPVVDDLILCEIDDEIHLAHAQNHVYPIIQRNDVHNLLRYPSLIKASLQDPIEVVSKRPTH
ncbi:MAG: phosphocholine cytidylyltransferase family protein [Gammaproteobacteria bacterium]|nr:phosphocholine cytidylyltransferase family protein [Gammaproteobacteria bacterium]